MGGAPVAGEKAPENVRVFQMISTKQLFELGCSGYKDREPGIDPAGFYLEYFAKG